MAPYRLPLVFFVSLIAGACLGGGCDTNPGAPSDLSDERFITEWNFNDNVADAAEPTAVAIDSTGRVYAADGREIRVYSEEGRLIHVWADTPELDFGFPLGLAIGPGEQVYVADFRGRVIKLDRNGRLLRSWSTSKEAIDREIVAATGIAVDRDGHVYVAERNLRRIQKFDDEGQLLRSWPAGRPASGERFWGPHALAISPRGTIYMIEWHGYEVYEFSSDGEFLGKWGDIGAEEEELFNVYGIAVDHRGDIYITDPQFYHIKHFKSDGQFVAQWGIGGSDRGEVLYPWGIAVSPGDIVYVADYKKGSIIGFGH